MGLSCSCDYDDDYEWYYLAPSDFTTLKTSRRVRCKSCNALIDIGATCTEFKIYDSSENGDKERKLPMHHCESCADIYFNLFELGYMCIAPDEDMRELLSEYINDHKSKEM